MKNYEKKFINNQSGFTLVEIIAVLVILGILAAVAVPKFIGMQDEAKNKAAQGAMSAAVSNASLSYSKFLLTNSTAPTGITSGDSPAWTATDATNVPIETDLGDFTATYEYANGTVTINIETEKDDDGNSTIGWEVPDDLKEKILEFGTGT